MDGFPAELKLSPNDWPEGAKSPLPGELAHFAPQGFGQGAPVIVRPYGGPPSETFYGFHVRNESPFLDAPSTESKGGTLYFDDGIDETSLLSALLVIGVFPTKDYVAFGENSGNPVAERYLDQLRFVSISALGALFGVTPAAPPPAQSLDVLQATLGFVNAQKAKWNDGYAFSSRLSGAAGGDGDWAKESLAFGFHVENSYWGIYRVWSRAWLVTK